MQLKLFSSAILSLCALPAEERSLRDAEIRRADQYGYPRPYTLDEEVARMAWRRARGLAVR